MLPNLVVIGAQKAGTSSLHANLDLHPRITMSRPKELDFFTGPGGNWDRGLEWYVERFDPGADVRGESSPAYAAYPFAQGVPERIRRIVPDVRLIYMVRDPIDRMVSEYVHAWTRGYERRPIEQVFTDARFEESGYLAQSRYAMQLDRYLEHFPAEQILVVALEDLGGGIDDVMRRVFRHAGVDDSFTSSEFSLARNVARSHWLQRALNRLAPRPHGRARFERLPGFNWIESRVGGAVERPVLDPSLRERLADQVRADADRLRVITGQRFASWSV